MIEGATPKFEVGDEVSVVDDELGLQKGSVIRVHPPHFGKVIYQVALECAPGPDGDFEYEESELKKWTPKNQEC